MAHGRAQSSLQDRLSVRRVIFLPLEERLDIARRDQFRRVARTLQFPRPVMRAAASFHHDEALRMLCHEALELRSRQVLAEKRPPARGRAMQREQVLCRVDADDANFLHGCPLVSLVTSAS